MRRTVLPLTVLCLVNLAVNVNACGMIVHQDVSDRALFSFLPENTTYPYLDIIKKNPSYW
jgi:hypothetical protein